jgi:uncharacterized glyoxalase superfamily protein PhnB
VAFRFYKNMAQAKTQKAVSYKEFIKSQEKAQELVDVKVPSGFVFKFEKPSKFSMLFAAGQLPLSATNKAVAKWQEEGVLEEGGGAVTEDQAQLVKAAFMIRDKVLKLSHTPKLVVGEAQNETELSTDDIADEDLDYLFKWVAAGGEASAMLGTFPGRSKPDTLASAGGKNKRFPVQQISGDQG